MAHHRQGRLQEAERLYRAILKTDPKHFSALHLLGVTRGQQGKFEEAAGLIGEALKQNPNVADAQNNLGNILVEHGKLDEALARYKHALALEPDYADAHYNLGSVLLALKQPADAIAPLQKALALEPANGAAYHHLGNALLALNRPAEAVAPLERALAFAPDRADMQLSLGNALKELGKPAEATARYERALARAPDYAEAHVNLGTILMEQDRLDEAVARYERAVALKPDDAEMHYNLGNALAQQGMPDDAIAHYERALALDPDLAEARLALCMGQLPVLYKNEPEIAERRAAYEKHLRKLRDDIDRRAAKADFARAVGSSQPFYLAYQGQNDRELQSLYGALVCQVMAEQNPPASLANPPGPGERVRVGFVSGFFSQHSNWKVPLKGWISQLDRQQFQVTGYHTGKKRDAATKEASALCDRLVHGPLSADRWREVILADAPHVLIYPEIGIDTTSGRLAAQRLAPVQCTSWGHPDTSGFPTLDYYLSSDLMEPPDGQQHYTEQLIRLPNLSIYYEPAEGKAVSMGRPELGLRAGAIVYWCGQSLFKYLPQFDTVYPRIAREVGDCQFVFIDYRRGSPVNDLFRARLAEAFAAFGLKADDHCIFLRSLAQDRFVAAMGQCDIFLDSIGWSGCNTTLESLAHDLPIVTLKTPLMRGRHSAAILQMMGVTDTIAGTVDEYVSAAIRLARDRAWLTSIKTRIADNKRRLYRDRACILALEDFLNRVARGKSAEISR